MDPLSALPLTLPPPGANGVLFALHEQLHRAILDGRLKSGLRLPSSRSLASKYGISRNTVIAAYERLASEGYLVLRPGSGTYVADVCSRRNRQARPGTAVPAGRALNPFWRKAGEALRADPPALTYDFKLGVPDTGNFRDDIWRRLSGRALRRQSHTGGEYDNPAGRYSLRDAIARHVSFTRSVSCVAEDVVVTAGAQQACSLLARILVTPGRTAVAVEDPGYETIHKAFSAAGARIVPVPVDEEGLIVSRLPENARVILVTPSHQFPLGVTMSMRRRKALLDFAHAAGAVVIEDDYDSEFRYGARPLDALQTLDMGEYVFYVGTFSKTLSPALRLGFVIVPEWARPAMTAAKRFSDWHCPVAAQDTLADFIDEGHLARHVRKMNPIYGARREILLERLRSDFHDWLRLLPAAAGLHLAATFVRDIAVEQLTERAKRSRLGIYSLRPCQRIRGGPPGLAFGFGAIDAGGIELGLNSLRALLDAA